MGNVKWNAKEVQTLKSLYYKVKAREIAEKIRRTLRAVYAKAEREGITINKRDRLARIIEAIIDNPGLDNTKIAEMFNLHGNTVKLYRRIIETTIMVIMKRVEAL